MQKDCLFGKYPYICTAIEKDFMFFLIRRDGRVVDYSGLENRRTERYRGFESLSLRQKVSKGFHNPIQNSLQNIDNRCKIKVLQRFFFVCPLQSDGLTLCFNSHLSVIYCYIYCYTNFVAVKNVAVTGK